MRSELFFPGRAYMSVLSFFLLIIILKLAIIENKSVEKKKITNYQSGDDGQKTTKLQTRNTKFDQHRYQNKLIHQ